MAAKDADLATDYFQEFVVLSNIDYAMFEVEPPSADASSPQDEEELVLVDIDYAMFELEMGPHGYGTGGGGGVTYRMRGFDQHVSVNDYVFWSSSSIDSGASGYTGSPGPVVDIVVASIIGA